MMVLAVVAILVVGPRDLPRMLRTIGQTVSKLRAMAGEFQTQFNDALKDADLDEIKKGIDSARNAIPTNPLKQGIDSITKTGSDIKSAIETPATAKATEAAAKPSDTKTADPKPADAKAADKKPADTKPAGTEKPAAAKPAATKPAADKPKPAAASTKPASAAKPAKKPAAKPRKTKTAAKTAPAAATDKA